MRKQIYETINGEAVLVETIEESETITSIAEAWKDVYADYKQARAKMQAFAADFNSLTADEKKIAASWFATSAGNINSVLTLDEQLAAGAIFDANSRESRQRRYDTVFNLFRGVLTTADSVKVMQKVKAYDFEYLYIKAGFEGSGAVNYKGDADPAGILDFINSTPGTPFAAAGIDSLNLQPLYGLTVEELKTRATNVIKYGNH